MAEIEIPGPAAAPTDLRTMLRRHLARRAIASLAASARYRGAALRSGKALAEWSRSVAARVTEMLGLQGLSKVPLRARLVSRHERRHHILENILFDSIDGWQTSATLFLPRLAGCDGPFPPIVVPCGHSTKTDAMHQLPPQVFARAGYAAILFDPPAQGGEKNTGNDHFTDGPRCYAVGENSQRYFVADALRAMDYLAGREDIDTSHGFAMTGVSGGGYTTMWAAAIDARIKVSAPVCCLASEADHPIGNLYAPCSETLPIARLFHGLDDADIMAAAAPRPQLYMHGLKDMVFTPTLTRNAVDAVAQVYRALGASDLFNVYAEDCDHEYTVGMARRFVAFADRHLLGQPDIRHHAAFHEEPMFEPREAMACHPDAEPNMRTISAAKAAVLAQNRPRLTGRADAARIVRDLVRGTDQARIERVISAPGSPAQGRRAFQCKVEELSFEHEVDVLLPATALWPCDRDPAPAPLLVVFDDRGRWESLLYQRWATTASRFTDPIASVAPAVLSVDLRGWGDTAPAPGPYDLAGWSGKDRWINYVAAALDDGLLGQRVRDGVAVCRWATARPDIDARRMVLAGHGLGGIVALMVAALVDPIGVVCFDMPESIESIVAAPQHAWPIDVLMPNILKYVDVSELVDAVAPVLLVRPRDELGQPVRMEDDGVAISWVWQRMRI